MLLQLDALLVDSQAMEMSMLVMLVCQTVALKLQVMSCRL